MLGKINRWVTTHKAVILHDAALFGGAFLATGVLDTGAPLTRDVIVAAIVTAARRVAVQLLTAK